MIHTIGVQSGGRAKRERLRARSGPASTRSGALARL